MDIAVDPKPPAEHLRVKLYPNAEATEGNLSLQRTEGYLFATLIFVLRVSLRIQQHPRTWHFSTFLSCFNDA